MFIHSWSVKENTYLECKKQTITSYTTWSVYIGYIQVSIYLRATLPGLVVWQLVIPLEIEEERGTK